MLKLLQNKSPLFYGGLFLLAVAIYGGLWISSRRDNWRESTYWRTQLAKTDEQIMKDFKESAEDAAASRESWTGYLKKEEAREKFDMPLMVGTGLALVSGFVCIKKGILTQTQTHT